MLKGPITLHTANYKHGEAFCHMIYEGRSRAGDINLSIWNSRDGVTPFMTVSHEYGIQLQHENWHLDKYDPSYKPKKGDLIWVSYDEKTAKKDAEEAYASHMEFLEQLRTMTNEEIENKYGYDAREHVEGFLSDKEKYIADFVFEVMEKSGEPQPRLLLVEEDWE